MSDRNYYEEGKKIQKAERYGEAFALYQQGADKDDAQCWYAIGNCYLDGIGVETDVEKALEAYQMASELGSAEAEYALGVLYQEGWYVREDFTNAISWLTRAAERGYAAAQERLGEIYQTWSTEEDCVEKAVYWYTKAMEQGHTQAKIALGLLYLTDEKFFNFEKANECLKDIANDLNDTIQCFIGDLYYHESPCRKQDYDLAQFWYMKAAANGNANASFGLGLMHYLGEGVSTDYIKAKEYFEKTVDLIQEESLLIYDKLLGRTYFYLANISESEGDRDKVKLFSAVQYYHKAIEKGYDCEAELSALETRINVGNARNNRMGKLSQEIIRKNLSVAQLYPEIENKIKQEFGPIWELLQSSSRECIVTGFLSYIVLFSMGEKHFEGMDFSAAIIPVVKGCEIEFERIFFKKFLVYLKKNKIRASEFNIKDQPFVTNKSDEGNIVYVDENKSGVYTLGSLRYYADIYTVKRAANSFMTAGKGSVINDIHVNKYFLNFINEIFKDEAFSKGNRIAEIKQYLYDFSERMADITKRLRNPAAHTEKMCYWAAVYCGNVIVMVEQILRNFLKKIKPEYLK